LPAPPKADEETTYGKHTVPRAMVVVFLKKLRRLIFLASIRNSRHLICYLQPGHSIDTSRLCLTSPLLLEHLSYDALKLPSFSASHYSFALGVREQENCIPALLSLVLVLYHCSLHHFSPFVLLLDGTTPSLTLSTVPSISACHLCRSSVAS